VPDGGPGDPGWIAEMLSRRWSTEPDPAAWARIRARAIAAYGASAAGSHGRRAIARALVAAAVAVLTAGTAVAGWPAVAGSLPEDRLYPIKLAYEWVRVAVARGPAAEATTFLDLAETRVEEMVRARAAGRFDVLPELAARYEQALARYVRAVGSAPRRDVADVIARARRELDVHRRVLVQLLEALPVSARAGIERAIEASSGAASGGPPVGGPAPPAQGSTTRPSPPIPGSTGWAAPGAERAGRPAGGPGATVHPRPRPDDRPSSSPVSDPALDRSPR
jgi:hypothetical protein